MRIQTAKKKTEIYYEWEKQGGDIASSPDGLSVAVNGFDVKLNSFKQNYIPSKTEYFKYKTGFNNEYSNSNFSSSGSFTKIGSGEGMPSTPNQSDINDGVYVKVINGRLYDPADKTMTLSGIASKSSNELNSIKGKWGQEMLVLSYKNLQGAFEELKNSAQGERLMKFIIGTLCFMFGFSGIFGPVIKILDIIPFIGKLANGIIYFIFAVVSLLLSVLFYVFFQFYWLILILAIGIPLLLFFLKKKKQTT